MFGLFSSRPPLTTLQRTEIELLMRQTVYRVGVDVLHAATVIGQLSELAIDPTDQESLLRSAAREVRQRMRLDTSDVTLAISDDPEHGDCYQHDSREIVIAPDSAVDPLRLVTALARGYALHILHTNDPDDSDPVDDRLGETAALCYGFGVLQSDASLYFSAWTDGGWTGWQASRQGYLSTQEIGYALALFARLRGEDKPTWRRWLRADSAETVKHARRHFRQHCTAESPLLLDADRIPSDTSSTKELARWLSGDDPTFALAAAWQLCAMEQFDLTVTESLHDAIASDDVDLVPVAITLLAGAGDRDDAARQKIKDLLRDRRPAVALAATKAAHGLGIDLAEHTGTLAWLLEKLPENRLEILPLIASLGRAGERLDGPVCHLLIRSLKTLEDAQSQALVDCLNAISEDPKALLERLVSPGPVRDEAIAWLQREPSQDRG